MALITCTNLSLGYDNQPIVSDLNFTVNEGDYFCIVGENGSGKSTLIKTLLNLLSPLSGTIEFGEGLKPSEIGYLPQQTLVQKDFPASVREVVISGCLNSIGWRPFYGAQEKERTQQTLERFSITHLAQKSYRELSGGQQQRVILARAFCATHKLLLLDEPVAGLDPQATENMYQLVAELNHNDGITIIMISHDLASVHDYASDILHIGHQGALYCGCASDYPSSTPLPVRSTTSEGSASWNK